MHALLPMEKDAVMASSTVVLGEQPQGQKRHYFTMATTALYEQMDKKRAAGKRRS